MLRMIVIKTSRIMIGKVLTRIFAMFGMTLTCVACYGVEPVGYNPEFKVTGRVVDSDGEPIPNILVQMDGNVNTSENGEFYTQGTNRNITFTDIDYEDNGGMFQSKIITLDVEDRYVDLGDVVLERDSE